MLPAEAMAMAAKKSGSMQKGGTIQSVPLSRALVPAGLTGVMNAATVVGTAIATALWNETRGSQATGWLLGELFLGFVMAANARPGVIQDMAFGVTTGAAVYLVIGPRSQVTGHAVGRYGRWAVQVDPPAVYAAGAFEPIEGGDHGWPG